jgi:hypothetical protein
LNVTAKSLSGAALADAVCVRALPEAVCVWTRLDEPPEADLLSCLPHAASPASITIAAIVGTVKPKNSLCVVFMENSFFTAAAANLKIYKGFA